MTFGILGLLAFGLVSASLLEHYGVFSQEIEVTQPISTEGDLSQVINCDSGDTCRGGFFTIINSGDTERIVELTNDANESEIEVNYLAVYTCEMADANGDSVVDEFDLEHVSAHASEYPCNVDNNWCDGADTTRNGFVDSSDMVIVRDLTNCSIGDSIFHKLNETIIIYPELSLTITPEYTINPLVESGAYIVTIEVNPVI